LNEPAPAFSAPRRHWVILACWTIAYLSAALVFAIGSQEPPAERPVDAPAAEFSSRRALHHLEAIAAKPRPTGSAEIRAARDYLTQTIEAIGLKSTVQAGQFTRPTGEVSEIANVIARLSGSGGSMLKAVLLVAHYDSVPGSPGASDDGSGTATLLETLRALKAGPIPKRDIIALFTDSEEWGLLGAKVFVGESRGGLGPGHPWMADVGLVLNFDASGNRGPAFLLETAEQNGWLIRQFAYADPAAIGNSMVPVMARMHGGSSDMYTFAAAGLRGLNFVFFEGHGCYHTPQDTIANLDGRSVQHQGLHALSLARHFGNLDHDDPRAPDVVYFNPVGRWLVAYPLTWVGPMAIAAGLLYVGLVVLGWRTGRVKAGGLAVGFVAFPVAIALGVLATWGATWLLTFAGLQIELRSIRGPAAACFFGLAVLVFTLIYAILCNRAGTWGLDLGALSWWTIATLALAWYLPEASFGAFWPLVFRVATTPLVWRISSRVAATLLSDLGALAALTIIGPGAYSDYGSDGPSTVAVSMALFMLGAVLPQLCRLFCVTGVSRFSEPQPIQ
jgi:Zn-dependent M28 family amino/carboxypeptidase